MAASPSHFHDPIIWEKRTQKGLVLMCYLRETFHSFVECRSRLLQLVGTLIRATGNLTDALMPQGPHRRHLCPCTWKLLLLYIKMGKLPFDGAAHTCSLDTRVEMPAYRI